MASLETLKAKKEKLESRLENYRNAEVAILTGAQSYTIDDGDMRRTAENASLAQVREAISALESELAKVDAQIASAEGTSKGKYGILNAGASWRH